MKIRKRVPKRFGTEVRVIPFDHDVPFVTLEDPADAAPQSAHNAFVRIRPPPDHDPRETASWRVSVARVARAVRVLPTRVSNSVPRDLTTGKVVDDVCVEATNLAKETGDARLIEIVESILDEVR